MKTFVVDGHEEKCRICGKEVPPINRNYCSRECYLKSRTPHGDAGSRLYSIWAAMKKRCGDNPDKPSKKYYKDKGIWVCDEWKDYTNFRDWANSSGYTDELTLDRKDTSKGYFPDNCRWATRKEQNRNTSKHMKATSKFKGVCALNDPGKSKFSAQIGVDGKKIHLGRFADEIDAARAYDEAAKKYFGEFANLNFPEG